MSKNVTWQPSPEFIKTTNLAALLNERELSSYEELHAWSIREPSSFWASSVKKLAIQLSKTFDELLDVSEGVAHPQWLKGARLNIADSCFGGAPKDPAIITKRLNGKLETISYEALNKLSNRIANGLKAAGLQIGDGVAIDMPMTAEAVAAYLGIVKAGFVAISVPDSLPSEEIQKRLRLGNAKAVFTQDQITRAGKALPMYQKVQDAGAPLTIVFPEKEGNELKLRAGDKAFVDFISRDDAFRSVICNPSDAINVIFSSGTTGDPKAIPWDHTTPIKCGSDGMYHQDIRAGDVVSWPTNLGWMMGPWLVFAALLNKATIALYEGPPTERGFCEFVEECKVTMLGLVPSIAKAWRNSGVADNLNWSFLRAYSSSGEASSAEDYGWLMQLNQPDGGLRPIVEYCGGTEIGGAFVTNILIVPQRPAEFSAKALGSEFVVLDHEGKPTPEGEAGEIFLVPPAMGLSIRLLNADNDKVYFENVPTFGDQILRRHGDQIIVGPNGTFQSDGRADDAMNLGGIKIGSVEIERTLNTHVVGVLETAAVAVPPPGGGPDRLIVYVVLKKDGGAPSEVQAIKSEMQKAIKQHLNPLFHVSDVIVRDTLPRTASNKIIRRALRKEYLEAPAGALPS